MSWKLVFGLSLFGLAMGLATVFVIPSHVEPYLWLGIFVVSAVVIAKRAPGRYFAHGLAVSLVNSVWITAAHYALFDTYAASHTREIMMSAEFLQSGRLAWVHSPQTLMLAVGPLVGLISGLVLGLFAYVASKFLVSSDSEYAGW